MYGYTRKPLTLFCARVLRLEPYISRMAKLENYCHNCLCLYALHLISCLAKLENNCHSFFSPCTRALHLQKKNFFDSKSNQYRRNTTFVTTTMLLLVYTLSKNLIQIFSWRYAWVLIKCIFIWVKWTEYIQLYFKTSYFDVDSLSHFYSAVNNAQCTISLVDSNVGCKWIKIQQSKLCGNHADASLSPSVGLWTAWEYERMEGRREGNGIISANNYIVELVNIFFLFIVFT